MAPEARLDAGHGLVDDAFLQHVEEHLAHEWLDAVRASLSLDPLADRRAAIRLDAILEGLEARGSLVHPHELLEVFRGRRVTVVAAGECVEQEPVPGGSDLLVAADGATSVILELAGTCPDIIVSDLDGVIEDILRCSRLGSIVVVHAHGDNVWLVEDIVPSLGRVAGTVQARIYSSRVLQVPGFTDGDRAVWLSLVGGAASVRVVGWCPGRRQHPLSKRLHNPLKKRKLVIGEVFLRLAGATGRVQVRG